MVPIVRSAQSSGRCLGCLVRIYLVFDPITRLGTVLYGMSVRLISRATATL